MRNVPLHWCRGDFKPKVGKVGVPSRANSVDGVGEFIYLWEGERLDAISQFHDALLYLRCDGVECVRLEALGDSQECLGDALKELMCLEEVLLLLAVRGLQEAVFVSDVL